MSDNTFLDKIMPGLGLTSNALKIIAIISMAIDHFGVAFLKGTQFYVLARGFGRLAFPIFCFLVIEGVEHTHDIRKYAIRLFAFAIVSEIPFDLMLSGKLLNISHQNVFFTLFIGVVMCWILKTDFCSGHIINQILVVISASATAFLIQSDYTFVGVLLIFGFYYIRDKNKYLIIAVLIIVLFGFYGGLESYGILSGIFLLLYNGEYGKKSKLLQYGFYAFYPLHLLLFGLIALWL